MNPVFYRKVDPLSRPPDIAHDASGNTLLGDLNTNGLRFGGFSGSLEISVSNSVFK
jgi:hypothetical protein